MGVLIGLDNFVNAAMATGLDGMYVILLSGVHDYFPGTQISGDSEPFFEPALESYKGQRRSEAEWKL